jgi:hypothetical protein
VPVAVAQRERLRDGLLGAEPHGQMAGRLPPLGRERQLSLGEQPLGEPGPALKRAGKPVDLKKVKADAGHRCGRL